MRSLEVSERIKIVEIGVRRIGSRPATRVRRKKHDVRRHSIFDCFSPRDKARKRSRKLKLATKVLDRYELLALLQRFVLVGETMLRGNTIFSRLSLLRG